MKKCTVLAAFLILLTALLACSLPSGNEPPSADQVATVVAATMQALTPDAPVEETPVPAGLLPHLLYFLNNDGAGITQVFRLETDGKTLKQVTFEPARVDSYDVSVVDGSVVYVSNNQLLWVDVNGSGRRLLVDGGPIDPNNQFGTSINDPILAPDGQTFAYWDNGLSLYAVSTGATDLVLENTVTDPFSGAPVPGELYFPQKYSPDGSKLLITVAIPNSDGISAGIYSPASDSLVRLGGGEGARICCGEQAWSADGAALFVGSASLGFMGSGLWRVDAASGNVATLIPSEAGGGNYNLATEPYLAPDGQLYYFFATAPAPDGFINRGPLQMVRSAADALTGRTILRPEIFDTLNEALWAPDASFVITAEAPSESTFAGGAIELYYTDGSNMVPLLPFGWRLKWGP